MHKESHPTKQEVWKSVLNTPGRDGKKNGKGELEKYTPAPNITDQLRVTAQCKMTQIRKVLH